jgi:excisionase family DNA binding protein
MHEGVQSAPERTPFVTPLLPLSPPHAASATGPLLTVKHVAALLGVSPATVYRLRREGQLPHVRILNAMRVRPRDVGGALQCSRDLPGRRAP